MPLDLSSLKLAIQSLDEVVIYSSNLPQGISHDVVRDSVIKRFEYTYELSWKMLQRWIKINISPEDSEPRTKKDLFRLAAKKRLIADPEAWFEFAEARNNAAHTYNERNAEYVYKVALTFLPETQALFKALEANND